MINLDHDFCSESENCSHKDCPRYLSKDTFDFMVENWLRVYVVDFTDTEECIKNKIDVDIEE